MTNLSNKEQEPSPHPAEKMLDEVVRLVGKETDDHGVVGKFTNAVKDGIRRAGSIPDAIKYTHTVTIELSEFHAGPLPENRDLERQFQIAERWLVDLAEVDEKYKEIPNIEDLVEFWRNITFLISRHSKPLDLLMEIDIALRGKDTTRPSIQRLHPSSH